MANDSITTVLSMVAWGTKLSFGLYDFSANVSSATGDVNKLAKEVNLLSLVLRQIGASLKEDGSLPSEDAFSTVRQVLQQCQNIFSEIEAIVPVRQLQDVQSQGPMGATDMALVVRLRNELDWNSLSQSKTQYLLSHLESLKLTLSVMLQTIYTAKITAWSRQTRTQLALDAVITERLQMESLIIEQQLSLIRAYKLYAEFRRKVANAPLSINQSPQSQALIRRDEYGPNPEALVPYQEPSLVHVQPSPNETEDLARIRRISSPFVDHLLARWTRIADIEERLQRVDVNSSSRGAPEHVRRRNWQQTTCESDSEDENEASRRQPKLNLSTPGPVLMPVDGDGRGISSPVGIPSSNLRPSNGPFSPQPSGSWTGASQYFSLSPSSHQRLSPGISPTSSPRTSFSSENNTVRPPTGVGPAAHAQQQQQQQQPQRRPGIPWRLRTSKYIWDHQDAKVVSSNTSNPPSTALSDRKAVTEIMSEYVSRDALKEHGYTYEKVKKDTGDGRRTRLESCYCIDGALSFPEIIKLVNLTSQIRNAAHGGTPPTPPSPLRTTTNRRSSVASSSGPLHPPLDRSQTAPGPLRSQSQRHSSSSYHSSSQHSHNSDSEDEDSATTPLARSSSGRRRSGSVGRRGSARRESDAGSPSSSSRSKYSKGNSKVNTLSKIAAGAGLATLLDGLPEVLSYL